MSTILANLPVCGRRVQVNWFGPSRSLSRHRAGSVATPRARTNTKRRIYAVRTRRFDPGLGPDVQNLNDQDEVKYNYRPRGNSKETSKGRAVGKSGLWLASNIYFIFEVQLTSLKITHT